MSAFQLNLEKSKQTLQLSLKKRGVKEPPLAEVAFDLDVSQSFDNEHRRGLTQRLLERLVPWGMLFDPDKKLDVFTFSDGAHNTTYVGEVVPENLEGFIERKIIDTVRGYNGGTDYSHVLERNLKHFGWINDPSAMKKPVKNGFFSRLFGLRPAAQGMVPPEPALKRRSIVFFVSDGEASDSDRRYARDVLQQSQKRGDKIYFQFIGCSMHGSNFEFLQEIAEKFDNTGLVIVSNIDEFTRLSDEEMNEVMIGDELVRWLKD